MGEFRIVTIRYDDRSLKYQPCVGDDVYYDDIKIVIWVMYYVEKHGESDVGLRPGSGRTEWNERTIQDNPHHPVRKNTTNW